MSRPKWLRELDEACPDAYLGCTYIADDNGLLLAMTNYVPPPGKCRWPGHRIGRARLKVELAARHKALGMKEGEG